MHNKISTKEHYHSLGTLDVVPFTIEISFPYETIASSIACIRSSIERSDDMSWNNNTRRVSFVVRSFVRKYGSCDAEGQIESANAYTAVIVAIDTELEVRSHVLGCDFHRNVEQSVAIIKELGTGIRMAGFW